MFPQRDGNIALKCAWNNKGYRDKCEGCPPGITPTCSKRRIHVHPELPQGCWEMNLFNVWEFGSGDNKSVKDARVGKIAIFTTKKPDLNHKSIIGITCITNIRRRERSSCPHGTFWSDIIAGDPELSVEIPSNIDISYENWDPRLWRQGLFRYLPNEKVREISIEIRLKLKNIGVSPNIIERLNRLIELVS